MFPKTSLQPDPTEVWIVGTEGTDQLGFREHILASVLLTAAFLFQLLALIANDYRDSLPVVHKGKCSFFMLLLGIFFNVSSFSAQFWMKARWYFHKIFAYVIYIHGICILLSDLRQWDRLLQSSNNWFTDLTVLCTKRELQVCREAKRKIKQIVV